MNNNIQKIIELTEQLNNYRNEYYNLNDSTISDSMYDKLFDELQALERQENFIMANSPTLTVGYKVVSKLQKRVHPTPLLSLDKTKSIDELNKWRKDKDIILMLKADGLTVELNYDNGMFIGGYTRGSGEIGEDITHNCKVFKNIPLTIPFKDKLRLSGEAIIHWNDFNNINDKLSEEEKYKTPRNLCSGSVRQLDSKICSERNVYFYAFNILECSEELIDNKYQRFNFLKNLGFEVIPLIWSGINCNIETISADINALKNWATDIEIPIDGIVSTFNSVSYSDSLSKTSHHPLHSLAFKFGDETEETILRDIEWNTTRTGQVNPTAIFDTVILDNTEVSRASLFNLTFIEDLQLNIGSRINVSKRNMIIPYIEENLDKNNGVLEFPKVCPACNGKTEIRNTGTADFLYCTNSNCSAQLLDKITHFCSRDALNIDGLSEATLEKFISEGFIKNISDVYKLELYKDKIVKMEGMGIKSYTKIIEAIEKSKDVKFENFVYSLGINQIGKGGAKRLAKYFNNDIEAFLEATKSHYTFMNIEDFGSITAYAVYDYFDNEDNMNQVKDLLDIVKIKQEEKKDVDFKSLEGLAFVVTGSVETFKNRKELEELITSLNGKLNGSVSAKTNFLINNDTTSTTGKNQKAKELGVKIISENEFNIMIGRS